MSQLTRGKTRRLMYLENKSELGDSGAARIGWVTFSKTGRSIHYGGKTFQRIKGGGISGNYFDVETGDEFWISGVKKTGTNRHWAGSGDVLIDDDARSEYDKIVAVQSSTPFVLADILNKRSKPPFPEIYCDLNARMTDHGFSLERRGSVDDLAKIGLDLENAVGQQFVFLMDDADDEGRPDDIMFVGTVQFDDEWGYLAVMDTPNDFFWRSHIGDTSTESG